MGFSFEAVDALDYEELRPGYASEAVRWVVERAGVDGDAIVVDLAAGTGHLSRRFVELGMPVVAVEPAGNLRRVLKERLPGVRTVGGVAERMPFGDGAVDLVVVGNAFHHFDHEPAFAELRRILAPRGAIALFWARTSGEGDPTLTAAERAVRDTVIGASMKPAFVDAYFAWRDPPERVGGFAVVERRSFPHTHLVASARLVDLYATSSDVASLPEPERTALLTRVRRLTRDLPDVLETAGTSDVDLLVRDRTAES
jgi:SAM-dependent methyltransferase